MAYRKPFSPQQRREALRAYRSYQMHQRLLRREFLPTSTEQSEILNDYADAVADMAEQLLKVDRVVNVDALNRTDAWARWLAMEYWRLRGDAE
jgi:hypothetical protein